MSDKNHGLFQGSGQQEPDKVVFRDDQNRLRRDLLVKDAKKWADDIYSGSVSYTQLRKFYSEALALKSRMEEKVSEKGKEEGFKEMEALVGMLISKANYSKIKSKFLKDKKKYQNEELFNFINTCITAVHSEQDFKDFVLFFEAVLGFFPRKN
jgi:CRISPR type III-A-associated protein Csm2